MRRVLLGLSSEYAYFKGEAPTPVRDLPHEPWFWCVPERGEDPAAARSRIVKAWEAKNSDLAASGSDDLHPLQKIKSIGPLREVQSFVHFGQRRKAFPVYAKRSYYVPDISDELFARHGVFTAEHDVPYQERAAIDLAAGTFETAEGTKPGQFWPFDTGGEKVKLKVLVYDIETTQWEANTRKQVPVDMLGWAEFEIGYRASVDLDREEFQFEITDPPPAWKDVEVFQDEAHDLEAEIRLLTQFVRRVPGYDIVSGHNILNFDNKQVYDRIQTLLEDRTMGPSLGSNERRAFDAFTRVWAARDRTFTFGQQSEIVSFHPTSLDTLNAARRFYFFLDDFGLKRLAPFMGINVPGRVYLTPQELQVGDAATRDYNKHDVQEQVGVTAKLLAQALPLAFTAGWTFEELLTAGNVKMWDHMGMIRAARTRKLAPATCRARGVARAVMDLVGKAPTREQVWTRARVLAADRENATKQKEFIRIAKYGDEMPEFVEIPGLVINPKAVDAQRAADQGEDTQEELEEEEYLGYSIPGGMTLHPQELGSHFVPWWHVVTADVGAMYPTILRARNVSADTIRLARKGETPDAWVWFFRVSDEFAQDPRWVVRPATKEESYGQEVARGVMVGIKKNPAIGVTASAMKAVMSIAARVKKQLGAAKKDPSFSKVDLEQLQMMYASLKANRNAGTHGQMLAVGVSCRGFNLFAGAEITTLGQKILADVQSMLGKRGARVVYGDSIVGSRCVVVKDPEDHIRVLPIERLYEAVGGRRHAWHGKDAVSGNGWRALSLDALGPVRASEWRPIVRVIRHHTRKRILRVRQPEGETICTEDHSIMAELDGQVRRTRPDDLPGSSLVRVKVPRGTHEGPIDLLPYLKPLAEQLEGQLGPTRRGGRINAGRRFGYNDSHIWFGTLRNPAKVRRFVDRGTRECSALCRLLGAYAAEGSVNWGPRQGASIANSDRPWIESVRQDFLSLFEGFTAGIVESDARASRQIMLKDGTVAQYKDRTLKVQFTNKLAALFFWALAGKGPAGKRVPDFVFNLPRYHQGEFLAAAVEGDGSWVRDPRYTKRHRRENFSYTTKSLELASGMAVILSQMGYDYGMRHQAKRGIHTLFTRTARKPNRQVAVEPWKHDGPVYDLEVEGTHTFVDAYGPILLHNTDGIYIGTSKSARNFPETAEALGEPYEPGNTDSWYILPDDAEKAIDEANVEIRKFLDYEAFDLESEHHDAMVFVVHKNYLIFDVKKGKLEMLTKGNNFRGSDKAPVAQTLLKEIMRRSLKDLAVWQDEAKAREALQAAIKKHTRDVIKEFDASTVDMADLTLIQVVQPESSYKPNPDGSPSIWIKRARALETVTKEKLRASKKYRFVVCKKPLPGIDKPSRTGIKPLDYMWPVDGYKGHTEVDLDWYKDMIEKYVRGAFGFEDLELHTQKGLDAWM